MSVPITFTTADERERLRGRGQWNPEAGDAAEDDDVERRRSAADAAMAEARDEDATGLAPSRFKTPRPVGSFGRPLMTP